MIPRILNQRSLTIYLMIAVAFVWISAGFAMAQHTPPVPPMGQFVIKEKEAAPEEVIKWGDKLQKDTVEQSKTSVNKALTYYIVILINPDTGIIYVPGSDRITTVDELAPLVAASNAAGNRIAPFSLFRWHNSPGCIFYVDSQGILRKKCVP
jgi:hypothetical protein